MSNSVNQTMTITKRDGRREAIDLNKIVAAVGRCAIGLSEIDPMRVALKTIGGLFDGATTQELDQLSIRTSAALTSEEPEYGRLAARLLAEFIEKEVANQGIHSFSQSIVLGVEQGVFNERLGSFVAQHARKLNSAIHLPFNNLFEYFGLRTDRKSVV